MKLDMPYIEHKSFQSKSKMHLKSIYNFDEDYKLISSDYKNNEYKSEDLFKDLRQIKLDLIEQVDNEKNKLFLSELFDLSEKILKSDLSAFSSRKGLSLNNESQISSEGFYKYQLKEPLIKEILKISSNQILTFKENIKLGKVSRDELQINSGPIIRKIIRLLNKEFKNSDVFKIIKNYTGKSFSVSGCSLELSTNKAIWWKNIYKEYGKTPKTTYFHFDESLENPKALIYLNDVDLNNGPFSIVKKTKKNIVISPIQKIIGRAILKVGKSKNSQLSNFYKKNRRQNFECEKFREDFSSLPNELLFNSHFGWDVIPGSKLEHQILKDELVFTGSKGTTIIFDGGSTLHRGGLVKSGERVALQIIFSKKSNFTLLIKILKKLNIL